MSQKRTIRYGEDAGGAHDEAERQSKGHRNE
ncbi:MAG: hypothetical protein H6Q33_2382 [Deltaproteobacteria bacterium]|nr:hypothetical protein [Deltaproteobacteria bacterium]